MTNHPLESLDDYCGAHVNVMPREGLAPLAFSQLAHWHLNDLGRKRVLRSLTTFSRIKGPLDAQVLRESICRTIQRHQALRTRILVEDHQLLQGVLRDSPHRLWEEDLTSLPEDLREREARRLIRHYLQERIDVLVDPLFDFILVKLDSTEYVIGVSLEHIIGDGESLGILVRDMHDAYDRITVGGQHRPLPPVIQFPDYARWQKVALESWVESLDRYWQRHFEGSLRVRFPEDKDTELLDLHGWKCISLNLGPDVRGQMEAWCRQVGFPLCVVVFAAYVGAVLLWCEVTEGVFKYQTGGRLVPQLETALGYFSWALYVRVALERNDRFIDLVTRVVESIGDAYDHVDFAYFATRVPPPECASNTLFNWLPQAVRARSTVPRLSSRNLALSPFHFQHPYLEGLELDHEPVVVLSDSGGDVVAQIQYPARRFNVARMERFGCSFVSMAKMLAQDPMSRVRDCICAS